MKNSVFWGVTPCGSCKNQHFRGTSVLTRATWCNILEDDIFHRMSMFVYRELSRMFRLKRDEVIGKGKKLHNESCLIFTHYQV
jgi:hypothetical protein